jgi:hypothetical protein
MNHGSRKKRSVGARVSIEDYCANMQRFKEIADSHGVKIVYLTRPHALDREDVSARQFKWTCAIPLYNDALRDFAKNAGVILFDGEAAFRARGKFFFGDSCHFNYRGRKKLARMLHRELMSRDLFPSGRPGK